MVLTYILGLYKSGSSGTSSFNVAVYDNTGAFVNTLFGSGGNALSISGSNGTNVIIGKNKVIFSGNRKTAQIIPLPSGVEVRANKLAGGFRFRAEGYRPREFSNDELRAANLKVTLLPK